MAVHLLMARANERFGQAVTWVMDEMTGHKLSLRQTNIRTGIDIDTLSRMRQGRVPRLDKVIDFARGFGLNVNEWLVLAGYEAVAPEPPTWFRAKAFELYEFAEARRTGFLPFPVHCEQAEGQKVMLLSPATSVDHGTGTRHHELLKPPPPGVYSRVTRGDDPEETGSGSVSLSGFRLYYPQDSEESQGTATGTVLFDRAFRFVTGAALHEIHDPFAETQRKLLEFRELTADWDSYGADPIAAASVRAARKVLQALHDASPRIPGEQMRPYHVAPLAHGGVQLEWRGPQADLEVEISAEGRMTGLIIRRAEGGGRSYEETGAIGIGGVLKSIRSIWG